MAPLAGLSVLATRMLGRSGRVSVTFETLKRTRADLAVIALYDLAGVIVAMLALILFGVTKPTLLVEYFNSNPWVAWTCFGVIGPLFAVGLIDRLPVERLVDASRRISGDEVDATTARGSALRRKAVERVLSCHYQDIAVTVGSERRRLLHRAKRLVWNGDLHFDEVATQLTCFAAEFHDGVLPDGVVDIIRDRENWPTDHDMFEAVLQLVMIALREGLSSPISIACRICEAEPVTVGTGAGSELGRSPLGEG